MNRFICQLFPLQIVTPRSSPESNFILQSLVFGSLFRITERLLASSSLIYQEECSNLQV